MLRNFRPGDYLIIDEVMGTQHWASEAAYDWDGTIRLASDLDGEHPDYTSGYYPDEHIPDMTSLPQAVTAFVSTKPIFVGLTTVTAAPGPAPDRFLD